MEFLKQALEQLTIPNLGHKIDLFRLYRDLVLDWNEKVNLTAIKDPSEFELKHFVDSLQGATFQGFLDAKNVIDVGTGAGFPGIPLAISYPEKQFILMDSLNKRIVILQEIVSKLGLSNVEVIHGRAEDLGRDKRHRERYDISLSRAVAHLSVLSEYCLPFVRVGGYFGSYKGPSSGPELLEAKKAIHALGGSFRMEDHGFFNQAPLDHRIFWIEKVKPTMSNYPRKAGIPSKSPL